MRIRRVFRTVAFAVLLFSPFNASSEPLLAIADGTYPSFFKQSKQRSVHVASFQIQPEPVTKSAFLSFVKTHPKWRKSRIQKIFSDSHYLQNWKSDLNFGHADPKSPVTFVSWYAAEAFCRAHGMSLPTTDQWEYALYDRGHDLAEVKKRILEWYSKPNNKHLPAIGHTPPNGFGVRDLVGLVWEWTLDFSDAISIKTSGPTGSNGKGLFCGNAAQIATDPSDYATFMRYALRSSLKANYALWDLGFRCVKTGR